nr:hypothetical protein [Tanacetum cinerariifolium]
MEKSKDDVSEAGDEMDEDMHHTDEEETQSPSPKKDQPESSHAQDTESDSDSSCLEALKKYDNVLPLMKRQLVQYPQNVCRILYNRLTEDQWEKHEEATALYADLKSEIEGFHDADYKVHKGTKAAFGTYDKLLVKFQAQYGKDAEKILGSLKLIQGVVKEDPTLNKKVIEPTEAYIKKSTSLTKILLLIKSFDFQGLKYEISSLKQDTSKIKSMMTEIFKAFKGQSSVAPSSKPPFHTERENDDMETQKTKVEVETTKEVPARLTRVVLIPTVKPITRLNPKIALIKSSIRPPLIDAILKILIPQPTGLVIDITPPRQPESSPVAPKDYKGKGIATEETGEPTKKLVPTSREEKIKKAAEEAKLLDLSKPELINVVQEETTNGGVDPKIIASVRVVRSSRRFRMLNYKSLTEDTLRRSIDEWSSKRRDLSSICRPHPANSNLNQLLMSRFTLTQSL